MYGDSPAVKRRRGQHGHREDQIPTWLIGCKPMVHLAFQARRNRKRKERVIHFKEGLCLQHSLLSNCVSQGKPVWSGCRVASVGSVSRGLGDARVDEKDWASVRGTRVCPMSCTHLTLCSRFELAGTSLERESVRVRVPLAELNSCPFQGRPFCDYLWDLCSCVPEWLLEATLHPPPLEVAAG